MIILPDIVIVNINLLFNKYRAPLVDEMTLVFEGRILSTDISTSGES
jgi:hypothetical protein